jgi:GNAT superfamily N-acetyltransferase
VIFLFDVISPKLIPSKMAEIKIRKAEKADMPGALTLIKELAEYEREPQEVVVTVADLERDGFGAHPLFHCFVAERENKILGIALYYIKYSTWKGPCVFLEDIIVTQSERRSGIGKMLFEEVMKASKARGARRMEWQVLDWNEPAKKFYEKYHPLVLEEWKNYRLTEAQL